MTVVTGGSRGIGAAICLRLAAEGHDVAVGYRSDAEAAEGVAERVRALGRAAVAVAVDTADAADVDHMFDIAAERLGPVTGLVNNAGVSGPVGPLAEADPEGMGMRQALEVNVLGYLLCARRAIGEMTAGGAIVNISSAAATLGSPRHLRSLRRGQGRRGRHDGRAVQGGDGRRHPGQLRRSGSDLDRFPRRPAAARQGRGTCPYGPRRPA
ncbi:short-chain dehydrogenase/reductase [Streptomyces albidoflavus]|nr:oxidoreductase [Streptomyces albidoflavus]EFE82825.1 short-chain dehydrogenase/reductase [Streptomyces albidoflavus]